MVEFYCSIVPGGSNTLADGVAGGVGINEPPELAAVGGVGGSH